MTRSFSDELRSEAAPIWDKIFAHPFLREVQSGTLPLDKFRYYVVQDFHYLEGFGRTVAIALSKAPDTGTIRKLLRRMTTPVERPLHSQMFELLENDEAVVTQTTPSPTNLAYINHMLAAARLGGVGDAAAALLPCAWTYHELGIRLQAVDHPVFSRWVSAYSGGLLEESTAAWRGLVDRSGAEGGPYQRDSMRRTFLTSSRYEFLFWTMAYNQERWHFT